MQSEIAQDIDRLPPDQRAVLSLVLAQGKSYAQVASMLGISEQSVRERAHTALDALARVGTNGNATTGHDQAAGTASRVGKNGNATTGRDQATGTASPVSGATTTPTPTRAAALSADADSAAAGTGSNGGPAHTPALRSSRTGGALLLGAIVVAIAVAAILLSAGGKGSSGSQASQPATHTSTGSTASRGGSEVHVDKQLTFTSANPALKASGHGLLVSEGGRRAFYVVASGLPPSSGFFYAVWLYNSPTSAWPLGRAPNVGSNGRLEGGEELNAPNPGGYRRLVITRETNPHPSHPGEIVLSAPFALH